MLRGVWGQNVDLLGIQGIVLGFKIFVLKNGIAEIQIKSEINYNAKSESQYS